MGRPGCDDDVIEDAATELVDAECLGYRYHRALAAFVKRRRPLGDAA